MASKLALLQEEEAKLLEIKERLKDQLRRLQVEELALRSMLQPDNAITEASIVDVNEISNEPVLAELKNSAHTGIGLDNFPSSTNGISSPKDIK